MNSFKYIAFSFLFLILSSTASATCQAPTTEFIQNFFSGDPHWTEVESQHNNTIHHRNPIEMEIDFADPLQSTILVGGKAKSKQGVRFCVISENQLVIRRGIGRMTFTRLSADLLISDDLINGRLYYRPDDMVNFDTSFFLPDSMEEADTVQI